MIRIGHFVAVLLSVPGAEQVGRVCVNQNIRIIEAVDQLQGRAVFDLHSPEALCRPLDDTRHLAPAVGGVCRFPALHVVLPPDLLAGDPETVSHHQPDVKVHGPLEAVGFGVLCCPGSLVDGPGIWNPVDFFRQPFRVLSYPVEKVHHIIVPVIDRFDVASLLRKKHGPAPEEWLQVAVMWWKVFDHPVCARILYHRIHCGSGCAHPKVSMAMFAPLTWWA